MSSEMLIAGSVVQDDARFALPQPSALPGLARRGLSWLFVLQAGKYVISLGSTAILARLLSPADYGLLAMAATFTALAQAFSDFGLSWATVQREHLTRSQIDALLLINSLFGLFLMGACSLAAPLIAAFYGRPELTHITISAAAAVFFSTVAVQPTALMRRQLRLKQLALCGLWSGLAASIAAIVVAGLGFGYWALVVQLVVQQALFAVLSFPMSGYRPSIPRSLLNLRSILVFGGYSAAYGIVNYVARNLDNVLIGKYWGAAQLGFYSRAYFLMALPGMLAIGMFGGVVIPSLAAIKGDRPSMERGYLRALRSITVLTAPMAAFLAGAAPELVNFVYGPRWGPVVPILLWLSAASILQPIQNTASWLYIVAEEGKALFGMALQIAGAAVIAFACGIHYGPAGVACAYAVMNTIIAYPILAKAHRCCGFNMQRTVTAVAPLLASALAMAAVTWCAGVAATFAGWGMHSRLLLKTAISGTAYLAALRYLAPGTYAEIVAEVRLIFRERTTRDSGRAREMIS